MLRGLAHGRGRAPTHPGNGVHPATRLAVDCADRITSDGASVAPKRTSAVRSPNLMMSIPAVVLVVSFFVVPLAFAFVSSLRPTTDLNLISHGFTASNYIHLVTNGVIRSAFINSFVIAVIAALACTVLAIPLAWEIAWGKTAWVRTMTYVVAISPLLTSVVVRSYGWRLILSADGPINTMLLKLNIIEQPLQMLSSPATDVITIGHVLFPFSVIAVSGGMKSVLPSHLRAAEACGAGPLRKFANVVVPNAAQGLYTSVMIVFSLSLGIYVTPLLIGGGNQPLLGLAVYNQVLQTFDQPQGAAIGFGMLAVALVVIGTLQGLSQHRTVQEGRVGK